MLATSQDPTELGTMVGAVVCAECGAAAVVPSQPLEQAAPWHCRACGHAHAAASIHSMLTGGAAVVQCPVELETKVKRRFAKVSIVSYS